MEKQELINIKWVLDEVRGCITENAEPILEASFRDEKCKRALVLASHALEMLEFMKSIFEDYEKGLIEDVEHVAIRAEKLYNKATTI